MGDDRRPSHTLRDVLVGLAILLLVIGLILPGISSRCGPYESTRCINNVKQTALALLLYANDHNRYPNAVTINERPGESTYTGLINSSALRYAPAGDAANPTGRDLGPLHGWVVDILPYVDQASPYTDFNSDRVWFDDGRLADDPSRPTNQVLSETPISVLVCYKDDTVLRDSGNLSYAVNMGFARWAGVADSARPDVVVGTSWDGMASDGRPDRFTWGPGGYAIPKKTAVMFVGTPDGDAPWDMHHTPATIRDGTSTTILIAENVLGGATDGTSPHGWTVDGVALPMGWASAHPNFVGFLASDDVCGAGPDVDCSGVGDLAPVGDRSGPGWSRANGPRSFERINYGAKKGLPEGGHPFANSLHPDGVAVGFCDGSARFVKETVDGAVWASLITPDGLSLPGRLRQAPLTAESLEW